MPHSFQVDGDSFQIVVEAGPGDTRVDDMVGSGYYMHNPDPNHFYDLVGVVPGYVGAFAQRSGFPQGAGGQLLHSGTPPNSQRMYFFPGTSRNSASNVTVSYNPYYSVFDDDLYVQYDESSTGSLIASNRMSNSGVSRRPVFGNDLVVVPFTTAESAEMFAGTVHADITGTMTCSSASATITSISSALTANQQAQVLGSFFKNTGDSDATDAVYRIIAVNSSTSVTLDRPYGGSNSGASKAFRISAHEQMRVTDGTFRTGETWSSFTRCAFAWGRFLANSHDPNDLSNTSGYRGMNTLRWSGAIGAQDEGTSPFTGMFGFDPSAYRRFSGSGGEIVGIIPYGDAVLVFQERLLTVVYGQPVFDGLGSLDFSTTYPISVTQYTEEESFTVSPYGVFFLDRIRGLCRWSGDGPPVPVGKGRVAKVIGSRAWDSYVFYHADSIIIASNSFDWVVYHIPTDSFTTQELGTTMANLRDFQIGRGEVNSDVMAYGEETLVAMDSTLAKVCDVGYPFMFPPSTFQDTDMNTDVIGDSVALSIETPKLGDPSLILRPRRIHVTYKLSENTSISTKARLTVKLFTGDYFPDTSGNTPDDSVTPSFTFDATPSPDINSSFVGNYTTRSVEVRTPSLAGPLIAVWAYTSGGVKDVVVKRIIVEGDVEGSVINSAWNKQ